MGKMGEGSLAAMGRLGLKELRNAFNPSRESVADAEIGMYGTALPSEVAVARGGAGDGPDREAMGLDDLRSAAREKDGPEPAREIER